MKTSIEDLPFLKFPEEGPNGPFSLDDMKPKHKQFCLLWGEYGSGTKVASIMKRSIRGVLNTRVDIETQYGVKLLSVVKLQKASIGNIRSHDGRADIHVQDGHVIIFSDAHYIPGYVTTAHRGLIYIIEKIKPKSIICNGDAIDLACISKHTPSGWEVRPTVKQELDAVQERLAEIEGVAGRAKLYYTMGNHDARFDSFLANHANSYEGVEGFRLSDHLPKWAFCWSVWINENTCVKHRWKNGIHATHNNTVQSGVTLITGHLHQLKITPYSDFNGRRYGVDTGTLAEPYSKLFAYTEYNPVNWCSGFVVLTFCNGELLTPEMVRMWDDNHIEFRGQLIEV